VGVLGTALTRDHVRLLRRYVDEATLLFDADAAGQNSALRSLDAFAAEELAVRVATLPDALDPDEFLRRDGAEAFAALAESGVEGILYKLDKTVGPVTTDDAGPSTRLAHRLDDVLATLALIPNAVTQSLEIKKVVQRTGIAETDLRRRIQHFARRGRVEESEAPAESSVPARTTEGELIEAMLLHPATIPYVREHLRPDDIEDPNARALIERLFAHESDVVAGGPGGLLARTQEAALRAEIERVIGAAPKHVADAEAWCRDLLAEFEARAHRSHARDLGRRLRAASADRAAEDDLLARKLHAAQQAQRVQGRLLLKKEVH